MNRDPRLFIWLYSTTYTYVCRIQEWTLLLRRIKEGKSRKVLHLYLYCIQHILLYRIWFLKTNGELTYLLGNHRLKNLSTFQMLQNIIWTLSLEPFNFLRWGLLAQESLFLI